MTTPREALLAEIQHQREQSALAAGEFEMLTCHFLAPATADPFLFDRAEAARRVFDDLSDELDAIIEQFGKEHASG